MAYDHAYHSLLSRDISEDCLQSDDQGAWANQLVPICVINGDLVRYFIDFPSKFNGFTAVLRLSFGMSGQPAGKVAWGVEEAALFEQGWIFAFKMMDFALLKRWVLH